MSRLSGPGLQIAASARGLAVGDYDDDGDPDLLVTAMDSRPLLLRNDTPLLQLRLENFRDYDLHFVTPVVIGPDDALNLSLSCTSPGSCDPAVFYSGYLRP